MTLPMKLVRAAGVVRRQGGRMSRAPWHSRVDMGSPPAVLCGGTYELDIVVEGLVDFLDKKLARHMYVSVTRLRWMHLTSSWTRGVASQLG